MDDTGEMIEAINREMAIPMTADEARAKLISEWFILPSGELHPKYQQPKTD